MNKFITCDIGKKEVYVYVPKSKNHYTISTDQFLELKIPELDGHDIVIEDAHLRSQEDDSLAQTWTIDQLKNLRILADLKRIEILCFPQKVSPKARKIASIAVDSKYLNKNDDTDTFSIAFYLQEFPEAYDTLKVFNPVEYKSFEKKVSHIYADRDALTEDSNSARNQQYGIKTDYSDAVVEWIKKYLFRLASELDSDTREWAGIELNKNNSGLKDGLKKYTSPKLKFIYGVINTILDPNTGEPRLRSDINKPPHWKYAKKVYFGLTPYHMHAGVTASNYKYHKRKAGSSCKKSMSLESKNAVKNLDDVREIREAMKESDRHLRDFWRTARKMIVEDEIR
jgi:hypothetical protein|tara:strand:+ start:227 stop:1246 length:1020 start_codon:yes stop_codon:yes gene_type:complete